MKSVTEYVLVSDVGGTHTGIAVIAHGEGGLFKIVCHKVYRSREVTSYPVLLRTFIKKECRVPVRRACIDFAGPVGPDRSRAEMTNLEWSFTAQEIIESTGLDEVILLNDFEAVGYGMEVLIANKPEAFVRLSRAGRLPSKKYKGNLAIIGAGTGLGTSVLVADPLSGRYRPVPGEGGHADFAVTEPEDFPIVQWIRSEKNNSPDNPIDWEKVVSGPGLVNVYLAMASTHPDLERPAMTKKILALDPYDRPRIIVTNAEKDRLCRKVLDFWIRSYARVAKNHAVFPLVPGGVFLAGGIAAKILPELQSGAFMKEFLRCDIGTIRQLLKLTPVFVVTEYRIGLYGCANFAVNFFESPRK